MRLGVGPVKRYGQPTPSGIATEQSTKPNPKVMMQPDEMTTDDLLGIDISESTEYACYSVQRPVSVQRLDSEPETLYLLRIADKYIDHELTASEAQALLQCLERAIDNA
jgi:hypothetical protein